MAVSASATVNLPGIQPSVETTNKAYLQPTGFKLQINRKYFPNLGNLGKFGGSGRTPAILFHTPVFWENTF